MENFYLGIDVSKGYADFIILNQVGTIVLPCFQLDDTAPGHHLLVTKLHNFLKEHPNAKIKAAVESTGSYENNWYHALNELSSDMPVQIARINPIGIRHHSKAAMKRTTTDAIAARSIAEYQIHHSDRIRYNEDNSLKSLKRFWSAIQILIKTRTQLLNELETLIYTANPGLMQFRRGNMSDWMLLLLKRYPDAQALSRATVKVVARIPYISESKARQLIEAAKVSVASSTDMLTRTAIVTLVVQIMSLNKQIRKNDKFLETELNNPQVDLLRSFKSIGIHSAVGLLIEIGCVYRFKSVKQLSAFVGVHPVFKESGDGKSCARMSKQGRKKARAILFLIALNAIQHNPLIKKLYEHELGKGKAKMAAIGVCMHKILRIVYGMLKNNQSFNPLIDQKSRERSISKKKQYLTIKNNFQDFDLAAPISARQNKKRKEQRQMSQSDLVTMCEINATTLDIIS